MTLLRQITEEFSRWIYCVASTIVAVLERFVSRREVQLIEEGGGKFTVRATGEEVSSQYLTIVEGKIVGSLPPHLATMLKGSRIELVLQPTRFSFRPLELPRRASEFLEGI